MKIVTDLNNLEYGPDYDKQYIAAGKYFIQYETGFVGSDGCEFVELEKPMNVRDWDAAIWDAAVQHASHYGTEPGPAPDGFDDDDENYAYDAYSENIEGWAVNYDPELHDGHTIGDGAPQFVTW